ncbi:MAG TPA: hypothetical protein VK524_32520 [Polyangiaceae bacterium]|nr:hypothetical protein [Polyangiaceae bacterium]
MRLSGSWLLTSALGLCFAFASGCGSARGSLESAGPKPLHLRRIEVREVDERPLLGLMSRQGDPAGALALAAAHDLGARASVALSALVAARLAEGGTSDAHSHVHALGFQAAVLVASPDAAARFVRAASLALSTPVQESEPALRTARTRLRNLQLRAFSGDADTAVAACSAELGVDRTGQAIPNAAELESWRQQIRNVNAVAFAAIGPSSILDAASAALADLDPWPEGDPAEDPWPARDVLGVSASDAERSLSIALRVPRAGAALHAARAIGGESSELALRLSALEPAWSIERVTAVARPRGACLRMDVAPPRGDPGPRLGDIARAALVTLEEAKRALTGAEDTAWALDESVLVAHDPREAASILAWRVLSDRQEPDDERRVVHFATKQREAGARTSSALADEIQRLTDGWQKTDLERRVRFEAGQGELWILLASPCGARAESEASAGLTATVLHALAARVTHQTGVSIEPWTTADGAGLLAHGPARGSDETARAHAQRLATALGRALVTQRLTGHEVAVARSELLDRLGSDPSPGYWLTIRSLSPGRPSLLEPRGTWSALSEAATLDAEAERRVLLQGPWRVAVLANAGEQQAESATTELERWLRPVRVAGSTCAPARAPAVRAGEITMEATTQGNATPSAYVAVALPSATSGPSREAMLTQWLLNQPRGWLEQALRVPGLASAARARLLGGASASALVIEIHALEGRAPEAVAQVRGLLERLARGAVTDRDVQLAEQALQRAELVQSLDPRRRIVELWRASPQPRAASLAAVRRMHQRALQAGSHVVVYVKPRD